MKPRVTFGDPESLQIDYLTTEYAARSESFKPATISPNFPTTALVGNATHIQVELEVGGAGDYPVAERANVRFTCYANKLKRSNVKELASLTMALVYAQPGTAAIEGARILIGRSDVITDPATKNLMVWFLAEITLSPAALAS
jgi:hypothetical protein